MAKRAKSKPKYGKTYLQEWLTFRNRNHEQLAGFLDKDRSYVTKIVNGSRPYSQEFLEAAADYLETSPASLLMRDPTQPEAIWSLWEHASIGVRREIEEFAEFKVHGKKAG